MIEQEGLNAWGIWDFSQWDLLAAHLWEGFEYGKQRCTAYPRFVVQCDLVDAFLDMYLTVVRSIRFGHPLAVEADCSVGDPLPELDFGPLISPAKHAESFGPVDTIVLVDTVDELLAAMNASGHRLYGNFPDYTAYPAT